MRVPEAAEPRGAEGAMKLRSDRTPMAGRRFGKWLVLAEMPRGDKRYTRIKVRCDCGYTATLASQAVREGRSRCCVDCRARAQIRYGDRCIVPGCRRALRTSGWGKGMCSAHYMRWRRGKAGNDLAAPIQKRRSAA